MTKSQIIELGKRHNFTDQEIVSAAQRIDPATVMGLWDDLMGVEFLTVVIPVYKAIGDGMSRQQIFDASIKQSSVQPVPFECKLLLACLIEHAFQMINQDGQDLVTQL